MVLDSFSHARLCERLYKKQAEADTRIAPATIPGAISGSLTRLNVSSGPAHARGWRRDVGVDETAVETDHDLLRQIALETDLGETVDVGVVRDDERQTVAVTLGSRPP